MSAVRSLTCLVLLGAVPAASPAASLYKCEGEKGAVSIQHEPCPRGTRQVWKREVRPEPEPGPEELAARAAAQAEAERAAEQARRQAQAEAEAQAREQERRREERKSQCHLAHDFQDQALALDDILVLGEAQKQRLRDWVVETCRDPDAPRARP
ncbi:hypothetical protein [Arenimonas fontis]|uniref:DUF4124 domain-containing protein n=1 Tax=Arenimonas fontis TaxID=2608255 RepID=A0A5B2Z9T3_9GAMM|nr:hypothetical protein [Arenimonas fontis]KAA2283964.1 hypothetical protein F0415_11710 [Arenimonas fontis]